MRTILKVIRNPVFMIVLGLGAAWLLTRIIPPKEWKEFEFHHEKVWAQVDRKDGQLEFMSSTPRRLSMVIECKGGAVEVGESEPPLVGHRSVDYHYRPADADERSIWNSTFGPAHDCAGSSYLTV